MSEKSEEVKKVLSDMGLTLESVFVPFSQSRNKAEKYPSLNWKVTLKKNGKDIVTTDYMAGCGHAPSYQKHKDPYKNRRAVDLECETGFTAKLRPHGDAVFEPNKKAPILPKMEDVVYSLVMDSDVLEYDFSDWCGNFGYDEDSRKAEQIYNDCMQIALKMNRSLGTDELNTLREVYQDY